MGISKYTPSQPPNASSPKNAKEVFNHKVEHLFLYKVVSNGDVPLSGVAWR